MSGVGRPPARRRRRGVREAGRVVTGKLIPVNALLRTYLAGKNTRGLRQDVRS